MQPASPAAGQRTYKQWVIDAFADERVKHRLEIWAYVIMPEHVHVLIRPKDQSYSQAKFLQSIKLPIARRVTNELRRERSHLLDKIAVHWSSGRVEHRFWQQGGGYDRNVVRIETVWKVIDYLHHNPVRRGLVRRAIDWPWSSRQWYEGDYSALLEMDRPPRLNL